MIEIVCTQKLINLSMAQTIPYTTGYILIGTRINFVLNESATRRLYECQHHLSLLYTDEDKRFDKISNFYQYR